MTEEPEIRAGDADRSGALDRLGQYFADGYLDIEEFEERTGRAAIARTRGELDALFADLPERPTGLAGEEATGSTAAGSTAPGRGVEPRAQHELDEVLNRGRKVQRIDSVIWSIAMAAFFLGLFVFNWPFFWLSLVAAGVASAAIRSVFKLDDTDETLYAELEKEEREQRAERLRRAAERRRELGQ